VTAKSRAKRAKGRRAQPAATSPEWTSQWPRPSRRDILDIEGDVIEETAGKKVIRQTVIVQPAPWASSPCWFGPVLLVMILLGIMGFELAQTQQGTSRAS